VWEHLLLDGDGVAPRYGLTESEVEEIGGTLWHEFAYQAETPKHNWKELEKDYWTRFIEEIQKKRHFKGSLDELIQMTDEFIRPVEGMNILLEKLQAKGIDLAICSNNNEFWFRRQMDKLELHRFFSPSKVVLSCRVGKPKSSPRYEMFHAVSDVIASSNSECVFVDDRVGNVRQALQCGITGIYFPSASPYGAQYLESLLEKMGI